MVWRLIRGLVAELFGSARVQRQWRVRTTFLGLKKHGTFPAHFNASTPNVRKRTLKRSTLVVSPQVSNSSSRRRRSAAVLWSDDLIVAAAVATVLCWQRAAWRYSSAAVTSFVVAEWSKVGEDRGFSRGN